MAAETNERRYRAFYLYFKRTQSLAGLKQMADQVAADAQDPVTINTTSYEGGSGAGSITCERTLLLRVIENLILELDPAQAANRNVAVYADFRFRNPW